MLSSQKYAVTFIASLKKKDEKRLKSNGSQKLFRIQKRLGTCVITLTEGSKLLMERQLYTC